MKLNAALFFCILSLISSKVLSINIDDERENGIDLNDKFLPVVYLKIGNSVCTGVLINHRSILTAAHCLKEGEQVTVYTGNSVDEEKDGLNTSSFI